MTQENLKQLLLKDLCARLPCHIHAKVWLKDGTTEEGTLDLEHKKNLNRISTILYEAG